MSKIICEICGTAYPDTENECPVCGFEKPENPELAPEVGADTAEAGVSIKGGRFTKSNVTKKQKEEPAKASAKPTGKAKSKNSDKGLITAIVVLLLAIVVTTGYIYFNYFAPQSEPDDTQPQQTTTEPSKETLPPQTEGTTDPNGIACTGLTLYEQYVTFNTVGTQWLLNVVPSPANTTDELTFSSADEDVATVDAEGYITAVADGETTITITCGTISVECKVTCLLVEEIPKHVDPNYTGLHTDADGAVRYYVNGEATYAGLVKDADGNYYYINSTYKAVVDCTYTIAEGKTNGLMTPGTYTFGSDGKMIIDEEMTPPTEETEPEETEPEETEPEETEPEETEPEETEPEETKPQDTGDFKLKKTDITFDAKGQTYTLYDGDIDPSKITWTVGKSSVATVKDGVVKAVGPGLTTVYAEYNGVKISCVIRCDF